MRTINKTTVIVVLAIFLCLSVGYALFSDTITIEGTATAQGNFDIEATCYTTIPDELKNSSDGILLDEIGDSDGEGYSDESCVVSDDKVTYSVGLEYPGAKKYYAVKFTNVGSIDSKIPVATISSQIENVTIETYNSETNELVNTVTGASDFFGVAERTFHFQKSDGTFFNVNSLSEEDTTYLIDTSDESNPLYLVRSGVSMYMVFEVNWPSGGYSEDGVYYKATQTIEFPFDQYVSE